MMLPFWLVHGPHTLIWLPPSSLRRVWCDSLAQIVGVTSRKIAAVGSARLLSECEPVSADAATFGKLLQAVLLMLLQDQGIGASASATAAAAAEELADSAEIENAGAGGGGGYAAAYAALSFANAQEESDLYPGESAHAYSVKALQALHSRAPTTLPTIVPPMIAGLAAEKQQGVQALLQGVC